MSITTNLVRLARSNLKVFRLTRAVIQQPNFVNLINRKSDNVNKSSNRCFCSVFSKSPEYSDVAQMDLAKFESVCGPTLDSLTEYFEEMVDADPTLQNSDVSCSVRIFCSSIQRMSERKCIKNSHILGRSADCEARCTSWHLCH